MKWISSLVLLIGAYGCSSGLLVVTNDSMSVEPTMATVVETMPNEKESDMKLLIKIDDSAFTATLQDNQATQALIDHLSTGSITLTLDDYGGFEKVGDLGFALPHQDQHYSTGQGDIVLYQGDQIVMFYGHNAWEYTLLAHVDDLSGWDKALGNGSITVELSLVEE